MFNKHDITRDEFQLEGSFARQGYDWWWHSFTGRDAETGQERSFFIEFFLCNPDLGGEKPVFGQPRFPKSRKRGKESAPKMKPSYLMVKAGSWGEDAAQLHRFFAWKKVEVAEGTPFMISAGDCFLTEDATCGSVSVNEEEAKSHREWMSDAGTMSWRLVMEKKVAFNVGYGAGRLLRRIHAFEMFWHAEGMKTAYRGQVLWNGRLYNVSPKDCYGYADKNWGRDFTSPWVWLSSCDLKSKKTGKPLKDSVFDIGGGRPKVGPVALDRKLLSAFWYEGRGFEFNFSKFWTFCRTKFDCRETKNTIVWHVEQRTWRNRMVADITCRKRDMLLVNYESPDGYRRHRRLWNGGTGWGTVSLYRDGKLVDTVLARHIGCEYGEYGTTASQAPKEVSGRPSSRSPKRRPQRRTKRQTPAPPAGSPDA